MKHRGLTLIELMIVLMVMGLMLGLGVVQYNQAQSRSLARQGAAQIVHELERARAEAKRLNQARSVRFSLGSNATSFQVLDAAGAVLRTVQLPVGLIMPAAQVNNLPATPPVTVSFLPPYGLVANYAGRVVVQLRLKREQEIRNTVELVSLLGKVIVR